MGKGVRQNRKIKHFRVSSDGEVDLPKSDALNVYDPDFGWILKDGKPTVNTKPYWEAQRRKLKQ